MELFGSVGTLHRRIFAAQHSQPLAAASYDTTTAESATSTGTTRSHLPPPTPVPDTLPRLSKCQIRRNHESDAEAIAEGGNNPKVTRSLSESWPQPYTVKDAHTWMSRASFGSLPLGFVICRLEDNVAIGGIGISAGDEGADTTLRLGYWLREDYWGRGIATEAVASIPLRCFQNIDGLERMEAEVYAGNDASCRVLGKGDFIVQEKKMNYARKHGKGLDVMSYYKVLIPSSLVDI